ncbi:MAG: GNAT family N-acetyltransferase [Burkholderiales bacterium]|nr:GNAT family N-acetyltransferase [Rhodocyclaceae bacterium]
MTTLIPHDTIRRYETLTLNTAPTLYEAEIDGWRVRASGTDTRRSNSATCISVKHPVSMDATIESIEAWFAAKQQAAVFRLTQALSPPGMDARLAERGYQYAVDCHFMTRPLAGHGTAALPEALRIREVSPVEGTSLLHTLKKMDADKAATELKRQQLWHGSQRFLTLHVADALAAIGLGRIELAHMGIFSMHTVEAFRGRGYAQLVINALGQWGAAAGAHTAFLQVEADNTSALSAYERAGFVPAYSYWHRIKPSQSLA